MGARVDLPARKSRASILDSLCPCSGSRVGCVFIKISEHRNPALFSPPGFDNEDSCFRFIGNVCWRRAEIDEILRLIRVRPITHRADPRVDIWDVLHDGEITIVHRQSAGVLVMFISIPYLRRRISPLGDSFRLRLGGFRGMLFSYDHGGETHSDLDYIEGFEILEAKSSLLQMAGWLSSFSLGHLARLMDSGSQPARRWGL